MSGQLFRSLTFLGTSSGTPTLFRNVSSYALSLTDGSVWLVDAGEGTQHQLIKCQNVSRGRIEKIFVTHLHGDHSFGLPGLMCSIGLTWSPPGIVPEAVAARLAMKAAASGSTADAGNDVDEEDDDNFDGAHIYDHFSSKSRFLELYGPVGLANSIRAALLSSEARFGFQYRVTELIPRKSNHSTGVLRAFAESLSALRHPDEADPRTIEPDADGFYKLPADASSTISVEAAPLDHRVFTVGYVVTEAPTPGTLLMDRVNALGVPKGPLLSKLKNGETIVFQKSAGGNVENVTVSPSDVVGPTIPGRTAILLGDTCDSTEVSRLVLQRQLEVDFLVHESTFDGDNQKLAIPRGHSTAKMAGEFAKRIRAKNLILTHFSARFASSAKDPETMERIRQEAASVTDDATAVHVADDFSVFDWERRRSKK